jgi:putative transposase
MIRAAHHLHPSLSIQQLCRLLDVSRSWFYDRRTHPGSDPDAVALRDAIEAITLDFPGYGYRRVTAQLHRDGWVVNRKRVLRIMREEALLCQFKRRFIPTTNSRHAFRRYPTLLPERHPGRIRPGWPISPTSACRPASSIWRRCWMPTPATAWAGSSPG